MVKGGGALFIENSSVCLFCGQGDDKSRARAVRAASRNRAAVPLGDFAADSQSDARTFVFGAPVKALKNRENAVEIFFVEADAVVFDGKCAECRRGTKCWPAFRFRFVFNRVDFDERARRFRV
jgi:hypothetical protein